SMCVVKKHWANVRRIMTALGCRSSDLRMLRKTRMKDMTSGLVSTGGGLRRQALRRPALDLSDFARQWRAKVWPPAAAHVARPRHRLRGCRVAVRGTRAGPGKNVQIGFRYFGRPATVSMNEIDLWLERLYWIAMISVPFLAIWAGRIALRQVQTASQQ